MMLLYRHHNLALTFYSYRILVFFLIITFNSVYEYMYIGIEDLFLQFGQFIMFRRHGLIYCFKNLSQANKGKEFFKSEGNLFETLWIQMLQDLK
jgi:hypothetical protein